jgi:hypothetical protein
MRQPLGPWAVATIGEASARSTNNNQIRQHVSSEQTATLAPVMVPASSMSAAQLGEWPESTLPLRSHDGFREGRLTTRPSSFVRVIMGVGFGAIVLKNSLFIK